MCNGESNCHTAYRVLCYYMQQDSITGLLLAGVGHVNEQQKKNFLIVDSSALLNISIIYMYKMLTYLQRRKYRRLKVLSKNTLSGKILPSCSSTNTLSHMKRYHLTMADKTTGLQCCLHRLRKKFVQQWISISKHFLPCWRSRRRIIHMVCRLNSPYLWRTNTLS